MLRPSEIGAFRGYRQPAGDIADWLDAPHDQPFVFSGTLDYDAAAIATAINLKTGSARALDPRMAAFFDASTDNADISFHVEGARLHLIDLAAYTLQDPEKWRVVTEGLYLEIVDGTETITVNLGPCAGFPGVVASGTTIDTDLTTLTTTLHYTPPAPKWIDFPTPLRFNLKTTKQVSLKVSAAAGTSVLSADSPLRLELTGHGWKGDSYPGENTSSRRKCGSGPGDVEVQKDVGRARFARSNLKK